MEIPKRHILPGFGLTLGWTIVYLSLIVLLPFSALLVKSLNGSWGHFWEAVTGARVVASYKLSFGVSFTAAVINGVAGLLTAWVLTRYEFPGRRAADALVDLPFALPTAVAGIALTALYAPNGWIGSLLQDWWGVKVSYTPLGVLV